MAVQPPPSPAEPASDAEKGLRLSALAHSYESVRAFARRALLPGAHPPRYAGYGVAVAGVALASCGIALVTAHVHIENISLLYLLLVLWLASKFGRGPAILASVLAFLAYDFFFIPPLFRLTVDDPTEWVSLFALLATSLVLGQLTAALRERAREAIASERKAVASEQKAVASEQKAVASEQRIATLYALAQLLVTSDDSTKLYTALAGRVVEVFRPTGVAACMLLLPDGGGRLTPTAAVSVSNESFQALDITNRNNASEADWAFTHGAPVGKGGAGLRGQGTAAGAIAHYFVPLKSGQHVVGVLGIAGDPTIWALSVRAHHRPEPAGSDMSAAQVELFSAFCDQIALTIERASLRRQAIQAEVLQESDRLKNALLGSVTHDLRTPLASIKAATSSLLQPGIEWSAEDRRELLTSIDASADRLNRLVSNLLDLSRLEAGAAMPVKDWYLIGDIVATVLDQLDLAGVTRQHHVVVDLPDDLPLVPMDYGQIEQVLSNLVENATKYSPAGSEIHIQARVLPTAELEVRVSDHGIGIPPGELHAVFDKFYRVQHVHLPWSGRPPVGTGLGLAISASIIQAHNGRIWAESQPGAGATFIFTLPIPGDRPRGALPEVRTPEATPDPVTSGGENIHHVAEEVPS